MKVAFAALSIFIANFLVHGLVVAAFIGTDYQVVCYLVAGLDAVGLAVITWGMRGVLGMVAMQQQEQAKYAGEDSPKTEMATREIDHEEYLRWLEFQQETNTREIEKTKKKIADNEAAETLRKLSSKDEE